MEEKELKTSIKQRIIISLIAIIRVGSMIAGYALIILNGGKSSTSDTGSEIDEAKIAEYKEAYEKKQEEFKEYSKADFEKFVQYKSEVKAYNETAANTGGVQTKDLHKGSGRKLTEGDTNYLAYYIGFCADESIFDSSFDDNDNPKGFTGILDASMGLIEGWNAGVVGMRIGGVREITIPGELAYGDTQEICGGYNKPLKFIVMAMANEGTLKEKAEELDEASMKLQYAYYGIDYDDMASDDDSEELDDSEE